MMLLLERMLDDRHEDALHHLLHDTGHDGLIGAADTDRRRLRGAHRLGKEVAIALPRGQKIFDGAVLMTAEGRAIIVHSDGPHVRPCRLAARLIPSFRSLATKPARSRAIQSGELICLRQSFPDKFAISTMPGYC